MSNDNTMLKNTMEGFQIDEEATSFQFKKSKDDEEQVQPRNSFQKLSAKKNPKELKRESSGNGFSLYNSMQQ